MTAWSERAALIGLASALSLSSGPAGAAESRKPAISDAQLTGYVGEEATAALSANVLAQLDAFAGAHDIKDPATRVFFWHEALLDAIAIDLTPDPLTGVRPADQVGPTRAGRALAIVMIAVYDAANAFEGKYYPYNHLGAAPAGASIDAAIAHAAHDALVALYPDQALRFDDLLTADLSTISASPASIAAGRQLGKASAAAILQRRSTDNSYDPEPNFGGGGRLASGATTFYGTPVNGGTGHIYEWTPDPLTPSPGTVSGLNELALGAFWGGVTPFALSSGDRYRVPPPPAPGTAEYSASYAEVAAIGGALINTGIPSTSTPETRFIGNYWGYDGVPRLGTPPRLYAQIAAQVALDKGLKKKATDVARFLAMVHVAQADSGIAAWDSKYYYNYWRPVTAIRRGDTDPATPTDASWSPFGVSVINTTAAIRATPPFPAYPSGHATFGAATFEVMRSFFGDNSPFTFISDEYDGQGVDPFGTPRPLVPVRFQSFTEAQRENGASRIYNGVHWSYDNFEGQALGVKIGRHVVGGIEAFKKKKAK